MSDPTLTSEDSSDGTNWIPDIDLTPLGPASASVLSYIAFGDPTPSWMLAPYVLTGGTPALDVAEEDVFYDASEEVVEDVIEDVFFDALAFFI